MKAASPNSNHFIFLVTTCYLLVLPYSYTTLVFIYMLKDIPVICSCLQWITEAVYSFVFGTVCAKLWRLHHIFNRNSSKPRKSLTGNKLILVILLPDTFDILVNILWSSIDPPTFTIQLGHDLMASASCKSRP